VWARARKTVYIPGVAPRVLIIGGGLAGLTAAFRLDSAWQVVVLEAGARLGGQIDTELSDGFVIERGAEGFVARSTAVPALAADLGMPEGELIAQATLRSYGFDGSTLIALEPGEAARFLGFQVAPEDLGKGIRSMRRGMGSLIWALAGNLRERVELRAGVRAAQVVPDAGGVRVQLADGSAIEADAAIIATSAAVASELLAASTGASAQALAQAVTSSSVTVELAFAREAIAHALDGSGFVVAEAAQQEGLRACTFTSSKFEDRAPKGRVSLRAFFRPADAEIAGLDDAAWIARAVRGIARVLPVSGEQQRAWVSRWPRALPVFDPTHRTRVADLEAALAGSALALAGSAFHGSGIDAAVRSGEAAALALGSTRRAP
jgi:oxygen-dependent protoporphyrinogen oxidase